MRRIVYFTVLFFLGAHFASADMLTRVNEYRIGQGKPEVQQLDALCGFTDVRIQQIQRDFSHAGFWELTALAPDFVWYENLASEGWRIRGERGVFDAWKASPTHNAILLSEMEFVCIRHHGVFWVLTGLRRR